jgi:transcriptional regulator with XRE-family HTH domain
MASIILDHSSNMKEPAPRDISQRIAARVRDLRGASGLSLEALAERSGVSRSMISLIERGESSATAVVLEKLAASLGVALAALFEDTQAPASPLAKRKAQPRNGGIRPATCAATRPRLRRAAAAVEGAFPPGARGHESGVREADAPQVRAEASS